MRPGLMRPLSVVAAAAVVLASLGGAWALTRSSDQRAPLAAALSALPSSTGTVDFTDWTDLDGSLEELGLRDVTTRSVLASLQIEMDDQLGWSVRDLAWEAYGRFDDGAVTVMGLGEVSAARAERSLARLGERVDGGDVWQLDPDAAVSADFVATFGWVRLVPSRGLLIGAADRASLTAGGAALDGDGRRLLDDRSVAAIARRFATADSVLLQSRSFLCSETTDDPEMTQQLTLALDGQRLLDPQWGGRALTDGTPQQVSFAVAFGSDRVARQQAAVRTRLTSGAFIGRTGQVSDSLVDGRVAEAGGAVSFDFDTTDDAESFMADVGPVAFAGCGP